MTFLSLFKRALVAIAFLGAMHVHIAQPAQGSSKSDTATFNKNYHADCPFCKIIAGQDPAQIIAETDDLIVIEKRPVRRPVDCLIIPKKHIVNIKDLDPNNPYDKEILSKMGFMAQELSKRLCGNGDFTNVINNGASSAQSVFHMHMHFKSPHNWKN